MAGKGAGFDATAFAAGIRTAMAMSAPLAEDDRATFYFPKTGTAAIRSADDVPFDPDVVHDRTGKAPVTVPCAVEYSQPADQDTAFGVSRPTRLKVTLLEDDYALVEGCEFMAYGGERYEYRYTETVALFDAGVRFLHFTRDMA